MTLLPFIWISTCQPRSPLSHRIHHIRKLFLILSRAERHQIKIDKNIHKQWPVSKFISCSTVHALVMKNLLKLVRNPSVLIMMILLPIIMVVSFCLAFRYEAYNIPFVIVNDELPYMLDNCPTYIQGCKHLESPCQAIASLPSISQFLYLISKMRLNHKKILY